MEKILFVGAPGSGKGTQAKLLKPYFTHINTGDLYRKAKASRDPLVLPYVIHVDAGGFLPDSVIFGMIETEISKVNGNRGYILDGAIRNMAQAQFAIEKDLVGKIIHLKLSDEEALKRIEKRRTVGERPDDDPQIALKRLEKYKDQTQPVLDLFAEKEWIKYYEVDASLIIPRVSHDICKFLCLV